MKNNIVLQFASKSMSYSVILLFALFLLAVVDNMIFDEEYHGILTVLGKFALVVFFGGVLLALIVSIYTRFKMRKKINGVRLD